MEIKSPAFHLVYKLLVATTKSKFKVSSTPISTTMKKKAAETLAKLNYKLAEIAKGNKAVADNMDRCLQASKSLMSVKTTDKGDQEIELDLKKFDKGKAVHEFREKELHVYAEQPGEHKKKKRTTAYFKFDIPNGVSKDEVAVQNKNGKWKIEMPPAKKKK